ncbi:MAG: hypothetical protein J0L84_18715 [Verrucomicrobia bacterium]|nr:hypothetical protein [Verrucomicrobiota bacterium]
MLPLLRANIGLSISLALLAGGALVCTLLGLIMARSGASLRPIWWFAGFFSLVVFPQVLGHWYTAVRTRNAEVPRAAALARLADTTLATAADRTADARSLFGPDADPQLISDVRSAYGEVFAGAEFAQFAVLPQGETVLLARFQSASAAEKAWVGYLRVAGLQSGGQGDSVRGYAVTRPVGDRAYALPFGTLLGVWTARDDAAIRQRMAAGGMEVPARAPLANLSSTATGGGGVVATPEKSSNPLRTALLAGAIAAYALLVILYFFKGVAWSGTATARSGVAPVSAAELVTRLESINALDVPFHVEPGNHPGELFATWRSADARWMDLARVRGLKRSFRVRMVMDEKAHTVRATDYTASLDWSAGRGGADLEWTAGIGLVLFQHEHRRVVGLQLDEQGRFRPELSYAYTLKISEIKEPLIEAVTRAGWNWRPTVWQGPRWLRWLTE